MKKLFLSICIMLLMLSQGVFAQSDINIFIDGQKKVFTPGPIIEDGSTLVPMRSFFESMGAQITWDDKTRSVMAQRGQTSIKLTIGSLISYINENKFYLTVKPKIIDEKTYVPLRFISESLGAQVFWDNNTRTITIKDRTKQALKTFTLVDTQKYEVKKTYQFTNYGDTADVDFDVMVGAVSTSPYQDSQSMDISPEPYDIRIDDYGNKYAKIKVENVQRGQNIEIAVTKKLLNSGILYNIDENNILRNFNELSGYNTYISPQRLIESDSSIIINKAKSLADYNNNPLLTAKNVYGFVNSYMTYDTRDLYAGKGALSGLLTSRGVCEEYSKLFVALLRANSIPSRSVFGYWLQGDSKDAIGYDWYDASSLRHEWPEFYLPSYGWIIAEPTFVYRYNGLQTIPWDQFAKQNENGHILYGYEPNVGNEINWSTKGYGSLDVEYINDIEEIRKAR